MTKEFLYQNIVNHRLAVLATVSDKGTSQSALIGFAVTPALKIIFDTVKNSRKYSNLLKNPSASLVVGWDDELTIQYEGVAKLLTEDELMELLPIYFEVFPDGVERKKNMKDIVYFSVEPTWIRFSNFNQPIIEEISF